jgi:hypothetical protein
MSITIGRLPYAVTVISISWIFVPGERVPSASRSIHYFLIKNLDTHGK